MTETLRNLLQTYKAAEEVAGEIEGLVGEILERLSRLREAVRMREAGLRLALGEELLPEGGRCHGQSQQVSPPAEDLASPAGLGEASETPSQPFGEANIAADGEQGLDEEGIIIEFGDEPPSQIPEGGAIGAPDDAFV
jgi:hypothetical protein